MKFLDVLYLVVLCVFGVSAASAQIDYATQIQPLFDAHCKNCHVPARSGWDVTNYTTVIASTGVEYASKVILPGNSAGSPITNKISAAVPLHGARMPRGGPYLSDSDIVIIKNWIDEGAKSSVATVVAHPASDIPKGFSLSQNYPNPFNPVTHIEFFIPSIQFVTLTIFDVIGRKVASLVNNMLQPGAYNIEWNGAEEPSGLYFYQLRATDPSNVSKEIYISTKKLIVQK
jgi:hypothetical protein